MGKFQIIVTKYYFEKPKIIGLAQYSNLKIMLVQNPALRLNRTHPVWKEYKWMLVIFAIAFVGILIGGGFNIDGIMTIGMIAFFLSFMLSLNCSLSSMINYYKYVQKRDGFYTRMKELILSCRDYNDFVRHYNSL